MKNKKQVLVTGAAGRIGSAFRHLAADRYSLRLADSDVSSLSGDDQDTICLDIADLEACHKACSGIDTVVHLAADPNPDADFYGSLLNTNIKGTFNIFRAAADAGCRRVVFASSAQTIEAYPQDRQGVRKRSSSTQKSLWGHQMFRRGAGLIFCDSGKLVRDCSPDRQLRRICSWSNPFTERH